MKILSFGLTALLIIILVVIGLNISSIVPSPERYAAATATILRAQNLATQDAAYVQAYQTAVPTRIAEELAAQSASEQAANDWCIGGLAMFVLVGLAVVVFIHSRSALVPRGKDGQLPGVRQGDAVTDMQRAIGPVVAVQNPSAVDQFWHLVKHKPLPAPRITTSDAGADADHLLAIAQSANTVSATAAMFQGITSNADRKARVELTRREGTRDPSTALRMYPWSGQLTPATVRIVANGDDAIEIIAQHIGDALPASVETKAIEPPRTVMPDEELTNVESERAE